LAKREKELFMKLEGHYNVPAPQGSVWNVLQDPSLLARVLPGCEKLELVEDNKYSAVVKIQVGPLQGTFAGTITLNDIVTPTSYRMVFDGKGALGFVKGEGTVTLSEQMGGTHVEYAGDATIGGKLAAVGQRLVEASARALISQTFDALTPIAQALTPSTPPPPAASGTNTPPSPSPPSANAVTTANVVVRRPSQVEFGLGVLKHMYDDSVPEPYRAPGLILIGMVLAFILISLLNGISDR
jgi:carbon monoxide dehydrogenase subunit G